MRVSTRTHSTVRNIILIHKKWRDFTIAKYLVQYLCIYSIVACIRLSHTHLLGPGGSRKCFGFDDSKYFIIILHIIIIILFIIILLLCKSKISIIIIIIILLLCIIIILVEEERCTHARMACGMDALQFMNII